jgi:hypothetical protein
MLIFKLQYVDLTDSTNIIKLFRKCNLMKYTWGYVSRKSLIHQNMLLVDGIGTCEY